MDIFMLGNNCTKSIKKKKKKAQANKGRKAIYKIKKGRGVVCPLLWIRPLLRPVDLCVIFTIPTCRESGYKVVRVEISCHALHDKDRAAPCCSELLGAARMPVEGLRHC